MALLHPLREISSVAGPEDFQVHRQTKEAASETADPAEAATSSPQPDAARRQLIADLLPSILHELCQPLASAALHTTSAERVLASFGQTHLALNAISQSGSEIGRAAALVESLQTLAAPSGEREPVDLNEVIVRAAGLVRLDLHEQGKILLLDLSPDLAEANSTRADVLEFILRVSSMTARMLDASRTNFTIRTRPMGAERIEMAILIGGGIAVANAVSRCPTITALIGKLRSASTRISVEPQRILVEMAALSSRDAVGYATIPDHDGCSENGELSEGE